MNYVFRCPRCGKIYSEKKENDEGKLICKTCSEICKASVPLEVFDSELVPSSILTITLLDSDGKEIEGLEFISTPWNPINAETFEKVKDYCKKTLKLIKPGDI